jgi:hypothetical protein
VVFVTVLARPGAFAFDAALIPEREQSPNRETLLALQSTKREWKTLVDDDARCDDATMRRCDDGTMRRCDDATMRRCDDAMMR